MEADATTAKIAITSIVALNDTGLLYGAINSPAGASPNPGSVTEMTKHLKEILTRSENSALATVVNTDGGKVLTGTTSLSSANRRLLKAVVAEAEIAPTIHDNLPTRPIIAALDALVGQLT